MAEAAPVLAKEPNDVIDSYQLEMLTGSSWKDAQSESRENSEVDLSTA